MSTVVVSGDEVIVIINNADNRAATDPFWVDKYINPTTTPTGVNQTWVTNGGEVGYRSPIAGSRRNADVGQLCLLRRLQ